MPITREEVLRVTEYTFRGSRHGASLPFALLESRWPWQAITLSLVVQAALLLALVKLGVIHPQRLILSRSYESILLVAPPPPVPHHQPPIPERLLPQEPKQPEAMIALRSEVTVPRVKTSFVPEALPPKTAALQPSELNHAVLEKAGAARPRPPALRDEISAAGISRRCAL